MEYNDLLFIKKDNYGLDLEEISYHASSFISK